MFFLSLAPSLQEWHQTYLSVGCSICLSLLSESQEILPSSWHFSSCSTMRAGSYQLISLSCTWPAPTCWWWVFAVCWRHWPPSRWPTSLEMSAVRLWSLSTEHPGPSRSGWPLSWVPTSAWALPLPDPGGPLFALCWLNIWALCSLSSG